LVVSVAFFIFAFWNMFDVITFWCNIQWIMWDVAIAMLENAKNDIGKKEIMIWLLTVTRIELKNKKVRTVFRSFLTV
jgi:hypothetical protein